MPPRSVPARGEGFCPCRPPPPWIRQCKWDGPFFPCIQITPFFSRLTNQDYVTVLLTVRNSCVSGNFGTSIIGSSMTASVSGAGVGFRCDICGAVYRRRDSLTDHRTHHEGRTTCGVCCATVSTVRNLRRHLRELHGLSADEVRRRTPINPL